MPKQKNHAVIKANALVEATYRLTVAEQRIILACTAQIHRDTPLTDEVMYSVTAAQFSEMSEIDRNHAYRDLEEAALRLKRREVYLSDEPNGKGRKCKVMITGWVQTIVYHKDGGRIELRFNKDMVPYLSRLSSHFTRYAISDVARMSSAHAIRLYELLIQWENVGERDIPLEWLQERLGIAGKYPVFYDFKRRLLEPSIKQINTLSPLHVTWQPIKTGRKVTALRFEFKRKRGKAKRALTASGELTREEIKRAAKPGETYAQATQRIRREQLRKARTNKPLRPAKSKSNPA